MGLFCLKWYASMMWSGSLFVCLLGGLFFSMPATSSQIIRLYYNERPPFLESQENAQVAGLTATPARQGFERAGIAYEWKKATAETQLDVIRANREPACLVGWYRLPERELIGKFSDPIYVGQQMIALHLASNKKIDGRVKVSHLFQDKNLILLVKNAYSYGKRLDHLINEFAPRTEVANAENLNMLSMLVYQRADYFLLGEDEAMALIKRSAYPKSNFKFTYFQEPIHEDSRHLWCSKQVPDSVIKKFNAALAKKSVR